MKRITILSTLFLSLIIVAIGAAGVKEIQWKDLVPELPPEENQLAGLSEEEAGWVNWIIYLRETLPEEISPENQQYYDEVDEALPKLKKMDIDIDEVISRRKYQNTAINSDLDGLEIKIAGYMLPLDISADAVTDFLLVPYFGACIHAPPPPPNQIVYAVTSTPTPYKLDELYEPVSVTGRIKIKSLSKELFLTDGSSDIAIGYHMSVEKIEEYKK